MSSTARSTERTKQESIGLIGAYLLAATGLLWLILWAGNTRSGQPTEGVLVGFAKGETSWTGHHAQASTVLLTAVLVVVPLWWWWDRRTFGPRRPITRAQKYMATVWQVRHMSKSARAKQIKRLGGEYVLPRLGYLARTLFGIYFGPEDCALFVTGPRQNKSSGIANPFIIEAPGAVLATSNKPGVIHDTREYREGPQYIFDPQNLYHGPNETPIFWDPLSYIRAVPDNRKVEKATTLAKRFMFATGTADSDDGGHWTNAAEDIIGAMLLAAAIDHRPITDCYRWVMSPNNPKPLEILQRSGAFPLKANMLQGYATNPDETRAGEYSNARTALSFLGNDTVTQWVTASRGRTEFDPQMMMAGGKTTLYVLSQEGEGSTGPLTAALTIAVYEAADQAATRNDGRLDVPMFFVLDEVANVCRWEGLPALYSHAGSKGILLVSLLQNYSQGKHVWGEEMMKTMLSTASIFGTGGNVKDNGFHDSIVNMGPSYEHRTISRSEGKNGASESVSKVEKKVLDVEILRTLPKEYSLLFCSNTPMALLRHVPTWRRGYKKADRTRVHHATSAPVRHDRHDTTPTAPTRERAGWGTITLDEE